ncbi:unnamed protein product [Caenorhabditis brenneri]
MVGKPTFPLYRLPYVALKVAFDNSHPHDILRLSMVSKKSYSVCKVFRKKVRNLNVRFNRFSDICSNCMYTIFKVKSNSEVSATDSKLESLKIKDTTFQVKMDRCIHILNFYCDDRLACLTTLYEYLTDFYEVPVHQVELDGDSIRALDGVLARQQTLANCRLSCSKSRDEEARWFLDRVENRKWLNGGGYPNLGYLELRLNSINVDTVLNDIEFIHRRHQNNVEFHPTSVFPWEFNESYEIKRNDGTIASVVMKNGQNAEFKLCVWPDLYGSVYPELQ